MPSIHEIRGSFPLHHLCNWLVTQIFRPVSKFRVGIFLITIKIVTYIEGSVGILGRMCGILSDVIGYFAYVSGRMYLKRKLLIVWHYALQADQSGAFPIF